MFKENNQPELFRFEYDLPKKMQNRLKVPQEKVFNHLIFRNIKESDYKGLYSDVASRPNVPVNILVALLVVNYLVPRAQGFVLRVIFTYGKDIIYPASQDDNSALR